MNPFLEYVRGLENGFQRARDLEASGTASKGASEKKVLLFSPHPDDECVTGLLPLRLKLETDRQVINIPVTFGSDEARGSDRARELEDACGFLGFSIHRGKDDLTPLDVGDIVRILQAIEPEILFVPHAADRHSRHIETHRLVMAALERLKDSFECLVIETEFWGAMQYPNLMVGGDADLVATLVAATSMHKGEVRRNPYHLVLPAWMQDNVRRGSELIGGEGRAAADISFATLYRVRRWEEGTLHEVVPAHSIVPAGCESIKEVFSWK